MNRFLLFSIGTFIFALSFATYRKFNQSEDFFFPRRVYMTKNAHKQHGRSIKAAIKYINVSVNQEIFSLSTGHGGLLIKTSNEDYSEPCEADASETCHTLAYFEPSSNKIVLLPQLRTFFFKSDDKLTIAHELLHALGFPHQESQVTSIVNEGFILSRKFDKFLGLKYRLNQSLPEHDKKMVLNLFNSQKALAENKKKQSFNQ